MKQALPVDAGRGMNPAEFPHMAAAEHDFWWYREMRRTLTALLRRVPCLRSGLVLEAGCGTGAFASVLQSEFRARVHLLDLASEGLAIARHRGMVNLIRADITQVPVEDGAYDAVVSLDVLVYLDPGRERAAIEEFARILRPGGMLVLRVAALSALRSNHSAFTWERQRFTRKGLLDVVRECGLRPVRCTYLNTLLLPIALLRFRVLEPLARSAPESGVRPMPRIIDRLLGSALALERLWLRAGLDFPVGQSLLLLARRPG